MEQEISKKYRFARKYFKRLLNMHFENPKELEGRQDRDVRKIFYLFLNSEESKLFERQYERINTLFNLLDDWYKTANSKQTLIKAGDFIDFCKSRQVVFSGNEIQHLFSKILGEQNQKEGSRISQDHFFRNFMKSIFRLALTNIMEFIYSQNSLKQFLPITLQVSNFQRDIFFKEFKRFVPNTNSKSKKPLVQDGPYQITRSLTY